MENGERPDRGGERLSKLEISQVKPGQLFEWAKQKQAYIREHYLGAQLYRERIDTLAEELEQYVSVGFSSLPEVIVESYDVFGTHTIKDVGPTSRLIEIEPLPYNNLGQTINGRLFGFHRGEMDDLRAYIATGEQPEHFMGGIYTPLLSVGVKDSEFKYAEDTFSGLYEQASEEVLKKITEYQDDTISGLYMLLEAHLIDKDLTLAARFKESAEVALQMVTRIEDRNERELFADTLWEVIRSQLHLTVPHEIEVSSHRALIADRGYIPQGKGRFSNVIPQLCVMGESINPMLGLYFPNGSQNIQVPIQSVIRIYRDTM